MSELEHALRLLGAELDLPPAPDVAGRVALPSRRPRPLWRRPLVIALAALALAVATAFAVPPARSALLRVLGLKGATITLADREPRYDATSSRRLGVEASLAEARDAVPFRLLVPPADVEVLVEPTTGAVTFSWDDRRLLLTEFRGDALPFIEKTVGPGITPEAVVVDGGPGYWIAGAHRVMFRTPRGRVIESRAAGNVLLWERGEVTLRLEGARSKDEAMAIAGTLLPDPV
ncbi:MAG TPA: hypothetical protein VLB86_14765 [Gaiellaceae bacterium]|nr:hypothetical protein [Gaiellaceae bacterium]